MNPYRYLFENPSELLAYTALVLLLLAWLLYSTRMLYTFYTDIKSSWGRWETHPIPDRRATKHISLFLVFVAINIGLVGAYVYLVF